MDGAGDSLERTPGPDGHVLSEAEAGQIAELARRSEAHVGSPRDVCVEQLSDDGLHGHAAINMGWSLGLGRFGLALEEELGWSPATALELVGMGWTGSSGDARALTGVLGGEPLPPVLRAPIGRHSRTQLALAAVAEDAAIIYRHGALFLAVLMAEAAAELAPYLDGSDVLELGAGAMPWGLALGDRVSLTGVDLSPVVEAVRELVAAHADVEWIVGDMFTVPLPKDRFDLVLVPNLLHLFGPARNVRLLRRAATAVRPGGAVAIIDALRTDGETDRSLALYDMSLASRTGEGRVYDEEEVRNWLRTVELEPTTRVRTEASPRMDLMVATRR